eukprot:jgi/Mesvir1/836/Mv17415-RA.2
MAVNGRVGFSQALLPRAEAGISAKEVHAIAACNPAIPTGAAASACQLSTYSGLKLRSRFCGRPCGHWVSWPGAFKPVLRYVVAQFDNVNARNGTTNNAPEQRGSMEPEAKSRHAVLPVLRNFESALCSITIEAPTDAIAATDALARLHLLQVWGGSEGVDENDDWGPTFSRTVEYKAGSNDFCRVCTTLVAETTRVQARASEIRDSRQAAIDDAAAASQGDQQGELTGMSPRASFPLGYDSGTVEDAFRNIKLDLVSRFECVVYPEGKVPHHLGPRGGAMPPENDQMEVYVAFRCAGRALPRLLDAVTGFMLQMLDEDMEGGGAKDANAWYPSPDAKVRVRRKPPSADKPRQAPGRPWGLATGVDPTTMATAGGEVDEEVDYKAREAAEKRAALLAERHGWMSHPGIAQGRRRGGRGGAMAESPMLGAGARGWDDISGGSFGDDAVGGSHSGDAAGGNFSEGVDGEERTSGTSAGGRVRDAGGPTWAPAMEARFGGGPGGKSVAGAGDSWRRQGGAQGASSGGWSQAATPRPRFEVYLADSSLVMGSMSTPVQMTIAPYCVGDHELSLTLTEGQLGDLAEAVSMITADTATLPARSFGARELLLPRTQPRQTSWSRHLPRALGALAVGGVLAFAGARGVPQALLFQRSQGCALPSATASGWGVLAGSDGDATPGTRGGDGGDAIVVTASTSAIPGASTSSSTPSSSASPSPSSASSLSLSAPAGDRGGEGGRGRAGGDQGRWLDAAAVFAAENLRPALVSLRDSCSGGLGRVGPDASKLRKRSPALLPYNDAVPPATLDRLCQLAVSWAGDTRPAKHGGTLTHTEELHFQVVTDMEGNLLGCRPANAPAVKQWVNLGVTQRLKRDAFMGRLLRTKGTSKSCTMCWR